MELAGTRFGLIPSFSCLDTRQEIRAQKAAENRQRTEMVRKQREDARLKKEAEQREREMKQQEEHRRRIETEKKKVKAVVNGIPSPPTDASLPIVP